MKNKLRQLDETFLDLVVGIVFFGVVSAILGMIITRGDFLYLTGAVAGMVVAIGLVVHMTVSVKRAVHMDTHEATKYMVKCSIIRYVVMLLVLVIGINGSLTCFLAIVIGFLSSKFSAFLQSPIHRYITKRILEE
ncbi:ATP synthase subunit I [Anaerostipes sp. MSJ-23]|uniref:ATP synthase subunit I n=1 Tax=Anaerostipes sp. MSJ-23 TaxID=2841520 RepID=UPI001C0FEB5D|nr:ATP synthase subunit I [Anaerostipes sp. MSJ-23]MBU5459627.1 ATP synthase subunit I [Anaerostipes sp. MSJ-23]